MILLSGVGNATIGCVFLFCNLSFEQFVLRTIRELPKHNPLFLKIDLNLCFRNRVISLLIKV